MASQQFLELLNAHAGVAHNRACCSGIVTVVIARFYALYRRSRCLMEFLRFPIVLKLPKLPAICIVVVENSSV